MKSTVDPQQSPTEHEHTCPTCNNTCPDDPELVDLYRNGDPVKMICVVGDSIQTYQGIYLGENDEFIVIRKNDDGLPKSVSRKDIHSLEKVSEANSKPNCKPTYETQY